MTSIIDELRAWGLTLPGVHRKSPWPEHDDLAVNDKTFAYLPAAGQPFKLSVKLPYTGCVALGLPFAEPTGYGLGKSGWVSFQPAEAEIPDLIQLKDGSRKATGRRRRAGWSRNWIPDPKR